MDKYLTVETVAQILGISKRMVWQYIRDGKLKALKIGKGYRIREVDLTQFIENNGNRQNDFIIKKKHHDDIESILKLRFEESNFVILDKDSDKQLENRLNIDNISLIYEEDIDQNFKFLNLPCPIIVTPYLTAREHIQLIKKIVYKPGIGQRVGFILLQEPLASQQYSEFREELFRTGSIEYILEFPESIFLGSSSKSYLIGWIKIEENKPDTYYAKIDNRSGTKNEYDIKASFFHFLLKNKNTYFKINSTERWDYNYYRPDLDIEIDKIATKDNFPLSDIADIFHGVLKSKKRLQKSDLHQSKEYYYITNDYFKAGTEKKDPPGLITCSPKYAEKFIISKNDIIVNPIVNLRAKKIDPDLENRSIAGINLIICRVTDQNISPDQLIKYINQIGKIYYEKFGFGKNFNKINIKYLRSLPVPGHLLR